MDLRCTDHDGDRSVVSLKKVQTNPIVLSFIVGILLFFLPVSLPGALESMVGTIASMNGPLDMIVLGIYLAQIPLKELFTEKIVYKCTFVRLVLIPVLSIALMMMIPKKYLMVKLAVLIGGICAGRLQCGDFCPALP